MPTEAELRAEIDRKDNELAAMRSQAQEIARGIVGAITQAPPQPQENLNDPQVIERRNRQNEVTTIVNQGMGQLAAQYYQLERQKNRGRALETPDGHGENCTCRVCERAEIMREHGQEIEQMIDRQPLDAQGHPEAYDTAIKAIKAKYFQKFADKYHERKSAAARAAAPPEEREDEGGLSTLDYDEEQQEEENLDEERDRIEERLADEHRRSEGRSKPPAPGPGRSSAKSPSRPSRKFEPLNAEEKRYAKMFGQTDEEYDRYSHNLTSDFLGLRKSKFLKTHGFC